MILKVSYGLLHHRGNVVPVQAFVFHLRSFKRGVKDQSLLRVSTVVEWNELRCFQLAHSYSTLWGKENEIA